MFPRLAPMRLSKHLNEKGRKKNGGINDEGVQKKKTPLYRNNMDMRDEEDVMTGYLKEDIIKLS